MTLDEKIDEILGHLFADSRVELIDSLKSKETKNIEYRNGHELIDLNNAQIVMPAEKLYEYQVYAKKALKELIEEEVAMDSWRVMAAGE